MNKTRWPEQMRGSPFNYALLFSYFLDPDGMAPTDINIFNKK
jgi:hypothetical protein